MKLQSLFLRISLFASFVLLFLGAPLVDAQSNAQSAPTFQAPAVPARITQAIDETQLVRLKGNVHPLARPEFDQGAVSPNLPLERMLLVLKRSPDQEAALMQLMADQYNTASPNYHKWLTPEQFGAQFGPADADIQTVTSWLQSHGFQVAKVTKGKIAIEFSGTAAQVNQAFRTPIHKFIVNGDLHLANAADPQIPAALAPAVLGLAPMNDFRPKPMHRVVGEFTKSIPTSPVTSVKPEFSTSGGEFAIGPTDFATIYNVLPLWNAATPIDGTGQSIAVVGDSNINLQDVADFRTLFALPTGGTNTPVVVIDGADPGIISGEETEALLDTEWSGAVARGAQIHLVIAADTDIAQGLILAIFHVIDNNSDPVLSVSFGNCEANLGTNGNSLFHLLWEQAAAQGITVTVSSGDDGSAGCEDQNALSPNPATTGLQVSGFASTPFNVAVGGTDFNDNTTQSTYFNSTNDQTTLASAKSYVPESTWNESCTNSAFNAITMLTTPEANCNSANAQAKAAVITAAGSGGPSAVYAKPAFQSFISAANGMPADGARDIPDVSLFSSSGSAGDKPPNLTPLSKSFYVVCEVDAVASPSCQKGGAFHFLGVGGTSASSPSFAGIMALVNQKTGQRQGNANLVLYKLAQQQFQAGTACASVASPLPNAACTFNDVTTGTIAMPCAKGSLNCTTTVGTDTIGVLSGFNAGAGYDLATGLGSVNANNLVTNWSTGAAAFTATSTTLALSPTTLTAGANVTVNITVTRSSGSTIPSGDVALVSTAANGQGVDGFTLDNTGKVVNQTTDQLTGGNYQVTARYGGDGTFAPSVSSPVTVTVSPASSTAVASVLAAGAAAGTFVTFTSGQAPVTLFLKAAVNPNGNLLPTGTVNFVDTFNGTPTTVASNVGVDSSGEAFTASGISTFAPGSHSIVAQYSGDPSFTASNSAAVTFTLTAPGSFTVGGSAATSAAGGTAGTSTITVTPSGGFTGMVNVTCPAANLPPGVTCSPSPLAINVTSASAATGTLTINVAAPSSATSAFNLPADRRVQWAGLVQFTAGGKGLWGLSAVTGFIAILILLLPGRKRYRAALALGLVCVLSFTLGCNNYNNNGGTATTTTKISVTSTKVASGTSVAFNVTVTSTGTRMPTGSVQLYDGTTVLGTAGTLTNGAATINISNLLSVGTHAISAHYSADAYSTASVSGTLNIAITGSTTFAISASPAASNASPTVNLTIN